MKSQLFQVPSIVESENVKCVERNNMSHAVLYNYFTQIPIWKDQSWILLFKQFTTLIWRQKV